VLVTAISIVSAIVLAQNGNAGSNPLKIKVTAQQFAWTFTYPDGKTYRFASPDAKTGLSLASLADLAVRARLGGDIGAQAAALELDDNQERDLMRDVMGATLDELTADGVSWVRIQKLNRYLFIHFAMGEDAATRLASSSGEASVPANRATRRASMRTTTLVKPATPRASHAGSTTRKKAAPKAKKV
jgi:heme/copper-type cytochrome/quinol oxidase subunit 2